MPPAPSGVLFFPWRGEGGQEQPAIFAGGDGMCPYDVTPAPKPPHAHRAAHRTPARTAQPQQPATRSISDHDRPPPTRERIGARAKTSFVKRWYAGRGAWYAVGGHRWESARRAELRRAVGAAS